MYTDNVNVKIIMKLIPETMLFPVSNRSQMSADKIQQSEYQTFKCQQRICLDQ